jgi:hypothetical protein
MLQFRDLSPAKTKPAEQPSSDKHPPIPHLITMMKHITYMPLSFLAPVVAYRGYYRQTISPFPEEVLRNQITLFMIKNTLVVLHLFVSVSF